MTMEFERTPGCRSGWSGEPLPVVDPVRWQGVEVPQMAWLVEPWVPMNAVTMISGDGGVGKSLLMQELMTSCALGRPWLGLDVRPCKVLGVFCEDSSDELHRRQARINAAHDVDFEDLERCLLAPRVGCDNLLWEKVGFDQARATAFYEQVLDKAVRFGAELVVVDSLHDVFGGNENARSEVRQFVQHLQMIADAICGAVILTAHPSLSGMSTGSGMSGSTAWNNAVRSRLYLTRPKSDDGDAPDENARVLSRLKANYAAANDRLALRWREGVIERDEPVYTGAVAAMDRRSADATFLELAEKLDRNGVSICHKKRAGNYAPKVLAKQAGRGHFTAKDFEASMWRLIDDGRLEIASDGPPSRRVELLKIRPEGGQK